MTEQFQRVTRYFAGRIIVKGNLAPRFAGDTSRVRGTFVLPAPRPFR